MAYVLLYTLCCNCILFHNYIETNDRNLQIIRETIDEDMRVDMEIKRQAILFQQLKEKYSIEFDNGLVEDEDYIIIINPNGEKMTLGKKLTV